MKRGRTSAIVDRVAREGLYDDVTFEQKLKTVREQECPDLGENIPGRRNKLRRPGSSRFGPYKEQECCS